MTSLYLLSVTHQKADMPKKIKRKYKIVVNPSTNELRRVLEEKWITEDRVERYNVYKDDGTLLCRSVDKFDDRGNLMEHTSYDEDNEIEIRRVMRYDDFGNEIKRTIYRGERDGLPVQYTSQYKYGEKGNVLERREFNRYRRLSMEVIYDDCGRMTERVSYDNEGNETVKESFVYDADGKLIEKYEHRRGEEPDKQVYEYDSNGNQIYTYYDKNGIESAGVRFTYDENNRKVDNRSFLEDGTVFYRESYGYDSEGRKNKQIEYEEDCVTVDEITTWEYDNEGRETSHRHLAPNGDIRSVWEYQYNADGEICMECYRRGDKIEVLSTYEYETKD